MITQELLDELWDFGDPAGSERRLASEAASQAHTDAERAELLTQQARALGLQERFDAARALLESLGQAADAAVRTRVKLEVGRLLNSVGNADGAVIEFEDAAVLARSGGLLFLEIDALHMLAIADRARVRERAAEASIAPWRRRTTVRGAGSSRCTTTSAARTPRPATSTRRWQRSCRRRDGQSGSAPSSNGRGRGRRSRSVPQPSGRVMPGDPGFRRGQAELPRTPARRVPQSPQGSSQNIDPGALMPN